MIRYVLVFIFSNKPSYKYQYYWHIYRMINTSVMKNHATPCIHLIVLSNEDVIAVNSHSTRIVMQALV